MDMDVIRLTLDLDEAQARLLLLCVDYCKAATGFQDAFEQANLVELGERIARQLPDEIFQFAEERDAEAKARFEATRQTQADFVEVYAGPSAAIAKPNTETHADPSDEIPF